MYIALFAAGILLDRLAKLAVMQLMSLQEQAVILPGLLNLFYITNDGAAFSILAGNRLLLIGVTVIALAVMAVLWRMSRNESCLFRIGLAAVASGAVGNLLDRIIYGEVIDFLQFGFWPSFPIFNVADIFIVLGVAAIVIDLLFLGKKG